MEALWRVPSNSHSFLLCCSYSWLLFPGIVPLGSLQLIKPQITCITDTWDFLPYSNPLMRWETPLLLKQHSDTGFSNSTSGLPVYWALLATRQDAICRAFAPMVGIFPVRWGWLPHSEWVQGPWCQAARFQFQLCWAAKPFLRPLRFGFQGTINNTDER